MNPEFLDRLNQSYRQVGDLYGTQFRNFNNIDTSNSENTTAQSTAADVADKILDIFLTSK